MKKLYNWLRPIWKRKASLRFSDGLAESYPCGSVYRTADDARNKMIADMKAASRGIINNGIVTCVGGSGGGGVVTNFTMCVGGSGGGGVATNFTNAEIGDSGVHRAHLNLGVGYIVSGMLSEPEPLVKANQEFIEGYKKSFICSWCGCGLEKSNAKCVNCGGPNN